MRLKIWGQRSSRMHQSSQALGRQLRNAARDGQTEIVERLIAGANVHHVDNDGWTALIYASENGHTEIVKILSSLSATDSKTSHELNGQIKSIELANEQDDVTTEVLGTSDNEQDVMTEVLGTSENDDFPGIDF